MYFNTCLKCIYICRKYMYQKLYKTYICNYMRTPILSVILITYIKYNKVKYYNNISINHISLIKLLI